MLCFSAHCTACSVLNDMTTTFTADSLQKQIRRDTKHEIFAFVEEDCLFLFFTKKAATGPNGPIFNKFPVYRAANGLDLNYIGPGLNYGSPLTSLPESESLQYVCKV